MVWLWLELIDDLGGIPVLVLWANDNEPVDPDALDIVGDDWRAIDIIRLREIADAEFDQFVVLASDVGSGESDGLRTGGVEPSFRPMAIIGMVRTNATTNVRIFLIELMIFINILLC